MTYNDIAKAGAKKFALLATQHAAWALMALVSGDAAAYEWHLAAGQLYEGLSRRFAGQATVANA